MASSSAAKRLWAMKESPNWLEMPDELMVNIFQRLDSVEILKIARKVCTNWRRICKCPAMWKVIKMLDPHNYIHTWDKIDVFKYVNDCKWDYGQVKLTKEAVDLSGGELLDITLEWFGTNDLLIYIVLRSKKLKRLCLMRCSGIAETVLSLAVKRLPHLETLHIHDAWINPEAIEAIGQNCPQLKSFTLTNVFNRIFTERNDYAIAIAKNMPELRHLKLVDSEMTNNGLQEILNGCPHLQSLDVRWCGKLKLGGSFGKVCRERIKDFMHDSYSLF